MKYCIVGTEKLSGVRKSLSTSYLTKEMAEEALWYWIDYRSKKMWKYVKVAKYPYKSTKKR